MTINVPQHYVRIAHALQPLIVLNGSQQTFFSSSCNIRTAFADACEAANFAFTNLQHHATRMMNDLFLNAEVADDVILDSVDDLKQDLLSLFAVRALIEESSTCNTSDAEAKALAMIVFNDVIMQIQHWLAQITNTILYPQPAVHQNNFRDGEARLAFNLEITLRPEFEPLKIWASPNQYQQASKPEKDNFWFNLALIAIGINLLGG